MSFEQDVSDEGLFPVSFCAIEKNAAQDRLPAGNGFFQLSLVSIATDCQPDGWREKSSQCIDSRLFLLYQYYNWNTVENWSFKHFRSRESQEIVAVEELLNNQNNLNIRIFFIYIFEFILKLFLRIIQVKIFYKAFCSIANIYKSSKRRVGYLLKIKFGDFPLRRNKITIIAINLVYKKG